jgi:hypothetical protein
VIAWVLRRQPGEFFPGVNQIIVPQVRDCQKEPGVRQEAMSIFRRHSHFSESCLAIGFRAGQAQNPAYRRRLQLNK